MRYPVRPPEQRTYVRTKVEDFEYSKEGLKGWTATPTPATREDWTLATDALARAFEKSEQFKATVRSLAQAGFSVELIGQLIRFVIRRRLEAGPLKGLYCHRCGSQEPLVAEA